MLVHVDEENQNVSYQQFQTKLFLDLELFWL